MGQFSPTGLPTAAVLEFLSTPLIQRAVTYVNKVDQISHTVQARDSIAEKSTLVVISFQELIWITNAPCPNIPTPTSKVYPDWCTFFTY